MPINDSRRDFLKIAGVAASLPLLSSRLAFAQTPTRRGDVVVAIFQRGGMDGLNAVVPCGDGDYYDRRGSVAIAEADVIALPGERRFGLHPSLRPLLPLYAAGELAVIHAVGAPTHNRSHFACQDLIERAVFDGSATTSGWLNRHLVSRGAGSDFQGVGIGKAVPRSLSGVAPVLGIGCFDDFALRVRPVQDSAVPATLAALHPASTGLDAIARTAFSAIGGLEAAAPQQHEPANGAVYPDTPFGQQLLQIAQLIKADVGLEVATVDIGGWDHHDDALNRLAPLLDEFARGIAALRTDLGDAMAGVSLISMSEFGRRVAPNASGGTDHGTAGCMFALGGGVAGGKVHADWPGLASADLADGDLAITTDYRAVLRELLRKRRSEEALQNVFPGYADPLELGVFRSI